jgi:hypothetical protein
VVTTDDNEYGADDEGEPEGEGWELDPNDPTHPDFDLSEAGYYGVEPEQSTNYVSRAVIVVVILLLLLALIGPACVRLFS